MSEPIFWLDRWFRLPDRNFGDHFTTTPGSPVTALSRNPNRIDLLVSGREGGFTLHSRTAAGPTAGTTWRTRTLATNSPSPPAARSRRFRETQTAFTCSSPAVRERSTLHSGMATGSTAGNACRTRTLATNSPFPLAARSRRFRETRTALTCLSRPRGGDLHYILGWRLDPTAGNACRTRTLSSLAIPPGSPVTALSRNPNRIDLFVSGREGGIYTTFSDGSWTDRWDHLADPNFGDQFTIPPGSPVTAPSRNPNRIDLFVSGREGAIYTTFWDGDWTRRWERLPDRNFGDHFTTTPGSPVTALSRNPNRIDLFVSGREGGIYATFSDGSWTDRWDHLADPNFGDQFTIPPAARSPRFRETQTALICPSPAVGSDLQHPGLPGWVGGRLT